MYPAPIKYSLQCSHTMQAKWAALLRRHSSIELKLF